MRTPQRSVKPGAPPARSPAPGRVGGASGGGPDSRGGKNAGPGGHGGGPGGHGGADGGAGAGRRGDVAGAAPEADLELAFAWSRGPTPRQVDDRDALFRFPAADDPEPRARRVLALAVWAILLTVAGLLAAARGAIITLVGPVPDWYPPAMVASGLGCLALTIAAFLTMHRRWAPWLLLGAATLTLAGNLAAELRLP